MPAILTRYVSTAARIWMQCAWCGRAKGEDGKPHGPELPLEVGMSHGICVECLAIEKRKLEASSDRAA